MPMEKNQCCNKSVQNSSMKREKFPLTRLIFCFARGMHLIPLHQILTDWQKVGSHVEDNKQRN